MNNEICIMIPNQSLASQIESLLAKTDQHIPVYISSVHTDEATEQANELIRQGAKVIICRGRIVNLLRDYLTIPIVEIRYSFDEFVFATKEALAHTRKVALVAYNDHFYLPQLADIFDFEQLTFRVIESPRYIHDTILELKSLGYEGIISGYNIGRVAAEHGLMNFPVHVSSVSLMDAIRDARHLRRLETEKHRQFESIASLLDHTEEGIISIDDRGMILSSNSAAERLLQLRTGQMKNASADYFPERLIRQILDGRPAYNEVIPIRSDLVLFSGIATYLDDVITGAVITLQPASDIHQKEYELRRRARAKGHVARNTFAQIIGHSDALNEAKKQAAVFAGTNANVLIKGETGTGKELFAQSIHNASPRHNKPFVAINCAALPESVLESELFGYVKGAFTGARPEGKAGIFEQAHTGTIFLDEISEISHSTQARLLRVIQEREITRVGDDKIIPIDVRLITSTNRDLREEIRTGQFREDLFYRINVLTLHLPSLQERREDIGDLLSYFVAQFGAESGRRLRISQDAVQLIRQLSWPGNIRQLRNFAECAVALCETEEITAPLIETVIRINGQEKTPDVLPVPGERFIRERSAADQEQARMLYVLNECGGNKTKAAKQLGIGYSTLWRRLKQIDRAGSLPGQPG